MACWEAAADTGLRHRDLVDQIRDHPSIESITLIEETPGKTLIHGRVVHDSQEARDGHLCSGVEHGMAASYDRLEALVTSH